MRKYSRQERTEKSINIPSELMHFVKKDTYSLVIKGAAGTGKTTLSLTILKALDIKSNFFYICTRVSPRQLSISYPWISKYMENQKERTSGPAMMETDVPINFEDARLDEPESLFERITNELMDVKAPLIIIDSWDALASFMDREARLNNERVLQTWRERAGAKLIFVNEDPADTSLDFVVDGAVKLDQLEYENARIREISLLKLRGIRITKPSYLFTLDKGSFRSFQTHNPKNLMIAPDSTGSLQFTKNEKNPRFTIFHHGLIKSGYDELDLNLGGGFPRRGMVVLEVDSNISMEAVMAFLFRIIYTFLVFGNVVFFEPPETIGSISANKFLRSYLSIAHTGSGKFIWVGPSEKGLAQASFSGPDKNHEENLLRYLKENISKEQRCNPNRLILSIMSLGRLQRLDPHDKTEYLRFARENSDLSIMVARKNESFASSSEISDISLKIIVINGTLILRTLYPVSPILAIEFERLFGLPVAHLLPLV
ncbi:MAG TPA: gas vesicle protein GvpD P-loop domain-containing protein [Nitrososphaeraceae archaeon]|nr:gas vesicle protein GvpD P-loop domain-containing protein [Nitrososphaeraceae archaeon]